MTEVDIIQTAKQTCVDYYNLHYQDQPPIDVDNLKVQIENFDWNGASYRIDVFFLHQQPSFIPYHENFWMSHRIWMKKNGKTVLQEPVYTSNAVHPELSEMAKNNILGFFPGNRYYQRQFDFIDQVLRSHPDFPIRYGPDNLIKTSVNFNNGILDLERIHAKIIQLSTGYQIVFEAEKYPLDSLYMYNVSFQIYPDGKCSPITSFVRQIPGLC